MDLPPFPQPILSLRSYCGLPAREEEKNRRGNSFSIFSFSFSLLPQRLFSGLSPLFLHLRRFPEMISLFLFSPFSSPHFAKYLDLSLLLTRLQAPPSPPPSFLRREPEPSIQIRSLSFIKPFPLVINPKTVLRSSQPLSEIFIHCDVKYHLESLCIYVLYESTAFQATATRVRKIRLSTEEIVEFGGERENELAFLDGGMSDVALPPAAGGKHEEDTHSKKGESRAEK